MRRVSRSLFLLCGVLLLSLLVACNPRPEAVEEVIEEGPVSMIENPEKLLEATPAMPSSNLIREGLERLIYYFDIPWDERDQEEIFIEPDMGYYSLIDFVQHVRDKGHVIVPTYGTAQAIIDQIDQGKPVLAEFPLTGASQTEALFYGYNEEDLFYYQVSSLRERKLPIERLNRADEKEVKLYIHTEEQAALEQSEYYFFLYTRDAFIKKDAEMARAAIERIEQEDWLAKDEAYTRFYILYYTFYDPEPELVEPLLEEISYHPILYNEIRFMVQVLREDREKAVEVMMSMNLMESQLAMYMEETILQVGLLALETERLELARTTLEFLSVKEPNYPGLQEALIQLEEKSDK